MIASPARGKKHVERFCFASYQPPSASLLFLSSAGTFSPTKNMAYLHILLVLVLTLEPLSSLDFSPQFCGGCFYESLCLATAAWEAADLSVDNCVDITEYVSPSADTNPATCPDIVVPTSCPSTFAPVTCAGGCYYNNECLATEAGATIAQVPALLPPTMTAAKKMRHLFVETDAPIQTPAL